MKNIPILEHDCSDFAIEYASGEYHPHEGETVWFIPYLALPDMIKLMALGEADESTAFAALRDDVSPVLAEVIDHWTWTGVKSDKPLGRQHNKTFYKPEGTDIAALSDKEIMYLVNAFFETTRAPEEKNPQPAS